MWLECGKGALVALRDLQIGDWLTIAPSDSESEFDCDDEEFDNACEDSGDASN